MATNRIYHISEDGSITTFTPRPSPSQFEGLKDDVVFGIEERLLHNYLLPRDCPRVTFYAGANTSAEDRQLFMHTATAEYVVVIEAAWLPVLSKQPYFVTSLHQPRLPYSMNALVTMLLLRKLDQ